MVPPLLPWIFHRSDRLVYAYFTIASDNRIVRMRYDTSRPQGEQLGQPETVLEGIPTGMDQNGEGGGIDGRSRQEAESDPERAERRRRRPGMTKPPTATSPASTCAPR